MKRQIPNLITLCNLLCGVIAVYYAFAEDNVTVAALFICGGIFFDFFDGLAARLLGVSSPIGRELDSLADVVTSGVAPAAVLMCIVRGPLEDAGLTWLTYVTFLIPVFAAFRLAKFNIDTRQSHSFLGLPVPSQALVWVGVALSAQWTMLSVQWLVYALLSISIVLDWLMVSEMPMFSLKFDFRDLSWHTNSVQYVFLAVCVIIIVLLHDWIAISAIILWYIILSAITKKKTCLTN